MPGSGDVVSEQRKALTPREQDSLEIDATELLLEKNPIGQHATVEQILLLLAERRRDFLREQEGVDRPVLPVAIPFRQVDPMWPRS